MMSNVDGVRSNMRLDSNVLVGPIRTVKMRALQENPRMRPSLIHNPWSAGDHCSRRTESRRSVAFLRKSVVLSFEWVVITRPEP
jgi:hypothetical protein